MGKLKYSSTNPNYMGLKLMKQIAEKVVIRKLAPAAPTLLQLCETCVNYTLIGTSDPR